VGDGFVGWGVWRFIGKSVSRGMGFRHSARNGMVFVGSGYLIPGFLLNLYVF
jgi:hypothetical protein